MSGTMMPQAQAPQMPPQMLAALMAARQQQQQPPMQPQAPGPAQTAVQGPAQMPQGAPAGQPQTPPPGVPAPMPGAMGPQGMAQQGRFGDSVMAHMTPGEIAVPPQVQTPELLAALRRAFAQAGVSPQQFTAGSPASSTNPATGQPEFSLWSALLPIAGAALGSFIPGIGTATGMALGGGLGGAAGGLIDHQGALGTLLGAAGGAAGGYLGGGGLSDLMGGGAGAATGAAGAAANPATGGIAGASPFGAMAADNPSIGAGAATAAGAGPLGTAAAPGISLMGRLKGAMGAGMGAGLASGLAPQQTASALPSGFGNHMGPINPNYGQLLGSGQSSSPTFANYSPFSAVMGPNPGYRFYPVG